MSRRVVTWASVTMDGCTSGPDGTAHDTWLYEHAAQEQTGEYFEDVWRGASTALLGRTNYEGFYSVWPGITRDPATDPRTRDLGRWLDSVEKVVVSRTLQDAPWEISRIARDLEAEVKRLKGERAGTSSCGAVPASSRRCCGPTSSTTCASPWCR